MSFPKRTDANQKEIVKALRACGLAVLDLSAVGRGCPDLLVSDSETMWLMEIKSEKGKLNERQIVFHRLWRGKPILIIRTVDEALRAIGKTK